MQELILLSCVVACISWTVSKTKIFQGLRNWVNSKSVFFSSLLSCPYCLSHWVALPIMSWFVNAGMIFFPFVSVWHNWILTWLIVVWLANVQTSVIAILWRKAEF